MLRCWDYKMRVSDPITDDALHVALRSIYEEVMWLCRRPNVTPGRARAWYTHVMAESVKRSLRHFTGSVSHSAVEDISGQRLHIRPAVPFDSIG